MSQDDSHFPPRMSGPEANFHLINPSQRVDQPIDTRSRSTSLTFVQNVPELTRELFMLRHKLRVLEAVVNYHGVSIVQKKLKTTTTQHKA